ncbi:Zinc finger, RING-type [Sesbania bispinosa]|nr:Zinc finger, RING-type [Sesbania bispinosa]
MQKSAESRIIITRTNPIGATNTNCPCSCSQGINKELLSTFPIIFYSTIKDLKTGKGPLECAVCLTDFKDQDTLRLLPKCNHVFHPQCIDSWLASHVTCPVCRANLNQDSCQVAITIPTHLTNDEEGSETRGQIQRVIRWLKPVKCVERYTPEVTRGLTMKGSSIEKGINEEEKVERWVLCAPPFVTRHG